MTVKSYHAIPRNNLDSGAVLPGLLVLLTCARVVISEPRDYASFFLFFLF